MMVAISDMSEVKMGQLYFNGCHSTTAESGFVIHPCQERPHKKICCEIERL